MAGGRVLQPLSNRAALWALGISSAGALFLITIAPVPFSIRSIERATGGQVLDTAFAYGPEGGFATLERLGETGRAAYSTYIRFDVVFACCYGAFFAGATFKLLQGTRIAVALATIPVATASFDVAEGMAIAVVLSTFPDAPKSAMVTASTFGVAKHIGFWASMAVAAASLMSTHKSQGRKLSHDG